MPSNISEPSLHQELTSAILAMGDTSPLRTLSPLVNEIERICSTGGWTLIELKTDTPCFRPADSQDFPREFSFRLRFGGSLFPGLSDSEKP